ncbi:hypothetical protein, partial [Heyndrickxia sporothermodurans]
VPIYWNSFTYYENKVRVRVEKYFFDTLPTGQTVDVSTFIEGGIIMKSTQFINAMQQNINDLHDNIIRLQLLNDQQLKHEEEILSILHQMVGDTE